MHTAVFSVVTAIALSTLSNSQRTDPYHNETTTTTDGPTTPPEQTTTTNATEPTTTVGETTSTDAPTTTDNANNVGIEMSSSLNWTKSQIPSTLNAKSGLTEFFASRMNINFKNINIRNIKVENGTLKINFSVVIDNSELSRQLFSQAAYNLLHGDMVRIMNTNTLVQGLAIKGTTVSSTATEAVIKCLAYQAADGQCNANEECVIVSAKPTCQQIKKRDDSALILGLGIGIPCLLIVALLIAACILYALRRRPKQVHVDDEESSDSLWYSRYSLLPTLMPTKFIATRYLDPVGTPHSLRSQHESSSTLGGSSTRLKHISRSRRSSSFVSD